MTSSINYTKIIMSVGMIAFVAALVVGATGAFFSDSETSTGNVFTAGAINLTVDSEQHYNNAVCNDNIWVLTGPAENPQYPIPGTPCSGTWAATDLGAQTFFNFTDVKPGDEGENTISLHVDSNDAYACVDVTLTKNDDVSTVSPELDAGDTPNTGSLFDGELAQNMTFFAWADNGKDITGATVGIEGDNIWQAGEVPLFSNVSGPASDVLDGESYTLADSSTGALPGGVTSYIGLAWCAGTIDASVPGTITCDGGTMGNIAQTDSMEATIAFRIEQARNNENFECGDILGANTDVAVNTNEVFSQTDRAAAAAAGNWFFYNDTNDTIMTVDEFSGTAGLNHMDTIGGSVGAYMKLGTETNPRYNIATYQFGSIPLASIGTLKYRVYDATSDGDQPFMNIDVDFATTSISGYQNRLIYVPGASTNPALAVSTWTDIDTLSGMWGWSGYAKGPDKIATTLDDNSWPDGNTNEYRTWGDIVASFPSATIFPSGFLGVRVGEPGPAAAEGYIDWIEFDGVKYDFQN